MSIRSKLLIIAGLGVVLIIIVVFLSVDHSKPNPNPCDTLIALIQKDDADASYRLFTKDAQAVQSASAWQKTVSALYEAYGPVKPIPSPNNVTPSKTTGSSITEVYNIYNLSHVYTATCYLVNVSGANYQINAFSDAVQ